MSLKNNDIIRFKNCVDIVHSAKALINTTLQNLRLVEDNNTFNIYQLSGILCAKASSDLPYTDLDVTASFSTRNLGGGLTNIVSDSIVQIKEIQGDTKRFNQQLENNNAYSKEIFNINPIASVVNYIIPFLCSGTTFYLEATGLTNFFWLYNGNKYTSNLLNINVNANDIVYLCINDDTISSSFKLDNKNNSNGVYLSGDLSDLQGKITYALILNNCSQITGDLSDLQGKITNHINLNNCANITGNYILTSSNSIKYIYLYRTAQTQANVDNTLNSLAQYTTSSNGAGEFNERTSASDEAVATLKSKGWSIKCGGVQQ